MTVMLLLLLIFAVPSSHPYLIKISSDQFPIITYWIVINKWLITILLYQSNWYHWFSLHHIFSDYIRKRILPFPNWTWNSLEMVAWGSDVGFGSLPVWSMKSAWLPVILSQVIVGDYMSFVMQHMKGGTLQKLHVSHFSTMMMVNVSHVLCHFIDVSWTKSRFWNKQTSLDYAYWRLASTQWYKIKKWMKEHGPISWW